MHSPCVSQIHVYTYAHAHTPRTHAAHTPRAHTRTRTRATRWIIACAGVALLYWRFKRRRRGGASHSQGQGGLIIESVPPSHPIPSPPCPALQL